MKFSLETNTENGFKLKTEASGDEERATVERLTLALIEKIEKITINLNNYE